MTEPTEERAFEQVAQHARFGDLVALVRDVATRAATARDPHWQSAVKKAEGGPGEEDGALNATDAKTEIGNVHEALRRKTPTAHEETLLRALWSHAVAESRPTSPAEEDELVGQILWLAAYTPFDATALLDRALGEAATPLWNLIGERLRQIDAGEVHGATRQEALVAAVALRGSSSPSAAKEVARLRAVVSDLRVRKILEGVSDVEAPAGTLSGQIASVPRHPAVTVALACTGILFVSGALRLLGRLALAYGRPAEVTVSSSSVRIHWRTVILGRTVRERDLVFAREGLAEVVQEIRYARAAFYGGILAVAIGSLVGVRIFVDGVRAASPSLLLTGLVVVAIGIGVDFLLGLVGSGATDRSRCRVLFVGRDGTSVCVADVDARRAQAALGILARGSA